MMQYATIEEKPAKMKNLSFFSFLNQYTAKIPASNIPGIIIIFSLAFVNWSYPKTPTEKIFCIEVVAKNIPRHSKRNNPTCTLFRVNILNERYGRFNVD